mmetsp:Transcript_3781/g.11360  ORF Transcript_3781/g.11360 Transcript_3781/m.11360 type:complete len:346 (+) Transcript_3781:1334-2371(+)
MPVFTASAPMSPTTASICSPTKPASTPLIELTPRVFWAVSAVIADIPKTPYEEQVFRSAWLPAPPPESDPEMHSTVAGFLGCLSTRPSSSKIALSSAHDPTRKTKPPGSASLSLLRQDRDCPGSTSTTLTPHPRHTAPMTLPGDDPIRIPTSDLTIARRSPTESPTKTVLQSLPESRSFARRTREAISSALSTGSWTERTISPPSHTPSRHSSSLQWTGRASSRWGGRCRDSVRNALDQHRETTWASTAAAPGLGPALRARRSERSDRAPTLRGTWRPWLRRVRSSRPLRSPVATKSWFILRSKTRCASQKSWTLVMGAELMNSRCSAKYFCTIPPSLASPSSGV